MSLMSTEATVQHKPSQKKKEPAICPKAQRKRRYFFFPIFLYSTLHLCCLFKDWFVVCLVWFLFFFKLNSPPLQRILSLSWILMWLSHKTEGRAWSGWFCNSQACCGSGCGNVNPLYRNNCWGFTDFAGPSSAFTGRHYAFTIKVHLKRFNKNTRCRIHLLLQKCFRCLRQTKRQTIFTEIPSLHDNREKIIEVQIEK